MCRYGPETDDNRQKTVKLHEVKRLATIVLLLIFLLVSILMPYGNFSDNYATRILYQEEQREDPDLNVSEFIFEKLLCIGQLFEDEDDAVPPASAHHIPVHNMHLQASSFECYRPAIRILELPKPSEKPSCVFRDNKFARDFSTGIFHPPSSLS